ncbi:MAG: tRNA (adenosine(37)-N6)-threonylcarbamoyltransferase complex dimerization subunit type 1 TsaB [Alphaproteobacteria bacterium]|nr:tRNA (adenosine(37)-N6)-threonylcarbamoyltransferase complex dimerization subunit type 1 TsaB [Alphaproteobacteria bacterium]
MRLLAFDCAFTGHCVALWENGLVASYDEVEPHAQAARLMPDIERLMAEAGWSYAGLDAIACTIGPGSFTGLRIGLATAKGLALAADKPIIGIGTLEALAAGVNKKENEGVVIAVDALREQVYLQAFDTRITAMRDAAAVDIPAISFPEMPCVLAGSGARLLAGIPSHIRPLPEEAARVSATAMAAHAATQHKRAIPGIAVRPIYIRPPDAKPSQKNG